MTTTKRRRGPGEGTILEYQTGAGQRFAIKYTAPSADGTRRAVMRRGFTTRRQASAELRTVLAKIDAGTTVTSTRMTVEAYLTTWLDGLRTERRPSTVASYRKYVRLHVAPYIGGVRLDQLTGAHLTALYRKLEAEGRADGTGGLALRTVRYVHAIVHKALADAVEDGLLAVNPADKSKPPTDKRARAASPEMRTWNAAQLRAFLDWSRSTDDEGFTSWHLLAMTGLRRGEALALRWSDLDLDRGSASVRRSAVLIKSKGMGERIDFAEPKSGKARVIDLDAQTVAVLRAHRLRRATVSLALVRDDALVLSRPDGGVMHPERFSTAFHARVRAAAKALGEDALPVIRLHDLRHLHATLLLAASVPVKVVSERLGHATPVITLTVHAHTMPGMQRDAVERLAEAVFGS
jgi:integrase